ncbi:MAG: TorF family putative porin [Mariprofundus sp.]|nr:TorF family putative porin [Mariprofundus sp.]
MSKQKLHITIAIASMMGLFATTATAEESGLSIGGDIGMASQYVWRGAMQKGTAAVQGDVSLSYDGFSTSAWFSNSYISPDPQSAGKEVVEFDFTADYSGSVGDLGYSVGGIYYTYMRDSNSNFGEVYGGISYDAVVSPSLTVYYTAKGVTSGFYKTGDLWVDLGLSTSVAGFDISGTASYVKWKKDVTNRPTVAGFNQYKNGFSLVQLGISKDIAVADTTITPSITFYVPTIGKSSDGNRYIYATKATNEFVASVNIAY